MEILGFLIIVGILIVFIVRRDLWSGVSSSKADEVEEASVKMRLQMEHTMNTLITQMDTRIHQIEGLVAAADERARTLEMQLAAVREEQASAQRKAEQEIAAVRAAQNSYYLTRGEPYPADYGTGGRRPSPWNTLADYRARGGTHRPTMQPIGEVSAVHRADYAARARMDGSDRGGGFAEALSASMQAAERNRGLPGAAYYGDTGYDDAYERAAYPDAEYASGGEWEKAEAAPQYESRAVSWPEAAPAEMVVEETPAVIVESRMGGRPESRVKEENEEEGPIFTPEQLEELAKTEAEVVVSSSVADVVDLPARPDDEDDAAPYGEAEQDEQTAAAEDEEEESYLEPEEDFSEDGETDFTEEDDDRAEEKDARQTLASPAGTDEAASVASAAEAPDDFGGGTEAQPEFVRADGESLSGRGETDGIGSATPPVTMRSDSPALRARELLEKGMSPAEVTKATGMGRGAVDLLAQMVKSQRKKESGD